MTTALVLVNWEGCLLGVFDCHCVHNQTKADLVHGIADVIDQVHV